MNPIEKFASVFGGVSITRATANVTYLIAAAYVGFGAFDMVDMTLEKSTAIGGIMTALGTIKHYKENG